MTKEEIMECKFINENMRFYSYKDFFDNKSAIKRLYDNLTFKTMYKWYVYANCYCNMAQKDIIWRYLNGEETIDFKISKKTQKRVDIL